MPERYERVVRFCIQHLGVKRVDAEHVGFFVSVGAIGELNIADSSSIISICRMVGNGSLVALMVRTFLNLHGVFFPFGLLYTNLRKIAAALAMNGSTFESGTRYRIGWW